VAEWSCLSQSCWCDRAVESSEEGPDDSSSCDDSSEYAAYACDVASLQLDCKIENDDVCAPDASGNAADDWVGEVCLFVCGRLSSDDDARVTARIQLETCSRALHALASRRERRGAHGSRLLLRNSRVNDGRGRRLAGPPPVPGGRRRPGCSSSR
jgi:hypothetical protein